MYKINRTITLFLCLLLSISGWSQTHIIEIKNVKTIEGLTTVLKGKDMDSTCIIKSFTVMMYPKKGNIYEIKANVKKTPSELKKLVDKIKVGDILVFTNVMMQCNNKMANFPIEKKIVIREDKVEQPVSKN